VRYTSARGLDSRKRHETVIYSVNGQLVKSNGVYCIATDDLFTVKGHFSYFKSVNSQNLELAYAPTKLS